MPYEYKVIPFVADLDRSTRRRIGNLSAQAAADHLQSLINSHAQDGWEFCSLERKGVRAPARFIAWLIGSAPGTAWLDLVILKREVKQDV